MAEKPTYEALKKRVRDLERVVTDREKTIEALKNVESELKQTKDAFRRSEETAQALLDASKESAFLLELDGTFVDMNEVTAARLGKSVEELIGKNAVDFLPPEVAISIQKLLDEVIRAKAPVRAEDTRSDFIFDNHLFPVLDSEGNVYRIAVFSRDITERRQAENELEQMAREWQSTFDTASDAIWLLDKEMRIQRANKISYQLFQNNELLGKHCWEIVHNTKQPIPDYPVMNAARSLHRETLELQIGENWFQVTVDPILNNSGEYEGAIHILTEITERKKAEKALRESEERYRALINTAPSVILHLSKDGQILGLNPEAEKLYGCSQSEAVGQNYLERFIPDGARATVYEDIKKVLGGERTRGYENPVIDAHGVEKIISWDVAPIINDRNEATGIISVGQDITTRKKTEERTEKINRLNEALLISNNLIDKLKLITDNVVDIFDADFSRIWLIKPGDLCDSGCPHAKVVEGPHVCLYKAKCLHLVASSGRYTHIDGGHDRVPFGCYKIGTVASGEEPKFLTNDVVNNPRVHDHEWAQIIGLVSFAGYRLLSGEGEVIGVLALFSKKAIAPEEDALLENIAGTTAQVIQTASAEDALRESEEKFKLLAEHSADVIYKVSLENERYTYASPSIEKVFGYTVEQILSMEVRDTLTPEAYAKQRGYLETAIIRGQTTQDILEVDVIHKDGHIVSVEIHTSFISDDLGNPVEILGVARDISERKKAETALRESELKYHDLYHNAPDMHVSVDAETGSILQCNNTLSEVIGYKNEEIIGRPVFDLYAPESAKYAKTEMFPRFIKTGEIKGEELQLQRKDGSVIDVSLNVSSTRDEKGNILYSRSAWRDITKQKQAEREKEKLIKELQEALKEIKTLQGILPLCSFCKKVRDDEGYWEQVDVYIHKHSQADISHGICPECFKKHYPDLVNSEG